MGLLSDSCQSRTHENPQSEKTFEFPYAQEKADHVWAWTKAFSLFSSTIENAEERNWDADTIRSMKEAFNIQVALLQRKIKELRGLTSESYILDYWFQTFADIVDQSWEFNDGCWRPVVYLEDDQNGWGVFSVKIAEIFRTEENEEDTIVIYPELSYSKLTDWGNLNIE